MLTAAEIALAFNSANTKATWSARPNSRPESGRDTVHFHSNTGLVTLVYNAVDNRFEVRFNKFQATWGDYVKSIARSLYTVLVTLKAAGLPFDAPEGPEGIEIIATATADSTVYVRWPAPIHPIMPELAERIDILNLNVE